MPASQTTNNSIRLAACTIIRVISSNKACNVAVLPSPSTPFTCVIRFHCRLFLLFHFLLCGFFLAHPFSAFPTELIFSQNFEHYFIIMRHILLLLCKCILFKPCFGVDLLLLISLSLSFACSLALIHREIGFHQKFLQFN